MTVTENLAEELDRRFRTVDTAVDLDRREVMILHPANADDLINEADFVKDERLPYWADLGEDSRACARE